MLYLTYQEYVELGGVCDLAAFNRNIDRVCGFVSAETHRRIDCMSEVPRVVKVACRDLVECAANGFGGSVVTSRSQSAGGVSESESYSIRSTEEVYADMRNILCDLLACAEDDCGTPLLYRGCSR